MKTIVVFRVFKDDNSVLALFPEESQYPNGECDSYQHVGQHGAADYKHCIAVTRPAKLSEYAPLKKELELLGYDLSVKTRWRKS
jgi:hypothetical protein